MPKDIKEKITFHFVDRMDEVIRLALIGAAQLRELEAAGEAPMGDEERKPLAARPAGSDSSSDAAD